MPSIHLLPELPSSTRSPPARSSSVLRRCSRKCSRTRSMPAPARSRSTSNRAGCGASAWPTTAVASRVTNSHCALERHATSKIATLDDLEQRQHDGLSRRGTGRHRGGHPHRHHQLSPKAAPHAWRIDGADRKPGAGRAQPRHGGRGRRSLLQHARRGGNSSRREGTEFAHATRCSAASHWPARHRPATQRTTDASLTACRRATRAAASAA
jgi:hypothetical protein